MQVVDGGAVNEKAIVLWKDYRRQGLMVSRIVFWCSFSNITISLVDTANKGTCEAGGWNGVEGGAFEGAKYREPCQSEN